MKKHRIIAVFLLVILTVLAAASCSSTPKLEGKIFYRLYDDGEGGYFVRVEEGWNFISETSAIWMDDKIAVDYEIDGTSIKFTHPWYAAVGEYVKDFDITQDTSLRKFTDNDFVIPVPEKPEAILVDGKTFLCLDPSTVV